MAGTIEYDLIGGRFNATADGNTWDRVFICRGLEATSVPELYVEAYALVPDTGTPAPAPISNMFVRAATIDEINCDPSASPPGNTWAKGVITYATPTSVGGDLGTPDDNGAGVTLSTVASVQEIETDRDAAGAQIVTTFDNVSMAHAVASFSVSSAITFSRLESSNPRSRSDTYTGRVNSLLWNGYAPRTVLCASVESETDDYGNSYRVTYQFTVRPGGWDVEAVHDDPFFPGRPLIGATGAARVTVEVLPEVSFAGLSITLP